MLILGIDEVGRGSWAGPLAVGAVVLNSENVPAGLKDSKKLTKISREKLARATKIQAVAIGVGWVDAAKIDEFGLTKSLKLAAQNAFAQIPPDVRENLDEIIIDGTLKLLDDPRATTLVRADAKIAAVSAAAIVAKVFRDNYMGRLDALFPEYHFAAHVGYGTAAHLAALQNRGVIAGVHRETFAPVAKILANNLERSRFGLSRSVSGRTSRDVRDFSARQKTARQILGKTSRNLGYAAETVAAEFLIQNGHEIVARNWKTKFCEIDIVSVRAKTLYFTEVKFRENAKHGDGLAAITPRKLAQMRKSAEIFLATHADFAQDFDVRISAISLRDNPPQIDEFVEDAQE